jgi:hypothetical protein
VTAHKPESEASFAAIRIANNEDIAHPVRLRLSKAIFEQL